MARKTTMLDLVSGLSAHSDDEAEVVATVVALVNGGAVELCGNFRGRRFDPASFEASGGAAAARRRCGRGGGR